MVTIKSKKEIELMRKACKVVAVLYDRLEKEIKPGMSTWEVDQIAEKIIREQGAIPAEKGYDVGIRVGKHLSGKNGQKYMPDPSMRFPYHYPLLPPG